MTHPHIITVEQLEDFEQEVVLASDTARGKRLSALIAVDKLQGHSIGGRMIIRDMKLPVGYQIVMITWDLRDAVEKYNSLG